MSEIFKGISKDSIAMVSGNLLHQVLQGILLQWEDSGHKTKVSMKDIEEMMRNVLSSTEALNYL